MSSVAVAKTIQIESPGPPAIVQELAPVVQEAKSFSVGNVESHATALERIKILRNGERAITEYFEPSRKAADAAKKEVLAARDGLIGPFAEARGIYDRKAQEYEAEERRKADEEARRLQDKARREEEERKLAEAEEAEKAGDKELRDRILEEPVEVPVVAVAPAVAQVQGVTTRTLWSADVFNLRMLIEFVAKHPEWDTLLEPHLPNLNRLAVSQQEAMRIPGVRAVSTISRTARRS